MGDAMESEEQVQATPEKKKKEEGERTTTPRRRAKYRKIAVPELTSPSRSCASLLQRPSQMPQASFFVRTGQTSDCTLLVSETSRTSWRRASLWGTMSAQLCRPADFFIPDGQPV